MTDLDRILNELGVLPRPVSTPPVQQPAPLTDPSKGMGIWYPDGNIPH